jgi:quinoprotein dehydrogenase-associated probable ABC transporter substrate-binding protein
MYSASSFLAVALVVAAMAVPPWAFGQSDTTATAPKLRVCADPNNLPFSNEQQQGFENRIATLISRDLGREVEYFWFREGEKFFRNGLNRGVCDIVMGVPTGFEEAATTRPYYRSTYVIVSRKSDHLNISSLDDHRLRSLRIGLHILGDQNDSVPPANALMRRGIVKNVVGFSIFGNLNEKNPPADVIHALEKGDVDVAIVWGPLGGYFSRDSSVPLQVTPLLEDAKDPDLPFHFDIAIGVRERDTALRSALDQELVRRRAEIGDILRAYGIPQVALPVERAQVAATAHTGRDE